ncbi:hypothetical protein [Klebsiella spallanzanii]|uniref:hypothetical protein n=1 Tax=Klebsiella spallanzanii TaxID=2587528 RepID=UPI002596CE42|nr:hypothetical protein [Klebsiella spallanzanii]MDM4206107.1 hypothetical protein [Klebsiella spallanzanii]
MKEIIWVGLLLLGYAANALATSFVGYLPMSNAEYDKKRAQRHLLTMPAPGEMTPGQSWHFRQIGVSGATLIPDGKIEDVEWQLIGKDKAGKPWSIPLGILYNAGGQAEFYRADFDRNGVQDVVVWRVNPGVGLVPAANLALIAFRENGRPCVFEPWGFYTTSGAGVDDLLDLQGNGRTQLLDMQFSEGYWVTDLYQVTDARWRRVEGWFGKLKYPALSRFTHRENRKLVIKPIAGRHPETEDLADGQRCL